MPLGVSQADNIPKEKESPGKKVVKVEVKEVEEAKSDHYKVGDELDCKDAETAAWFEVVIEKITANDDVKGLDNLTYHVKVIIIMLTNRLKFTLSLSTWIMKKNRKSLCSS